MGRLGHAPFIQHFSHPHQLELTQTSNSTPPYYCSGCELQSSGWMYSCRPCNFTLHLSCTQMPQLINHPSHPYHPLTLLPSPIYSAGLFNCDGCGHQGHGFSYHCNSCDFDLHILCASKPLSLTHQSHSCPLLLTFYPPYQTKGFSCDICRKFGSTHWLYRCSRCEFDAHLDCATANIIITNNPARAMAQTQSQAHNIQQYNSFPGANQMQCGVNQNQQFVHSQSMGSMQTYQQQQQQPLQQQQQQQQQQMNENALMNAVVQGFVEGAAQQVGQNFVQSMMNGDNNCDPGNSGGIDIGSSILGGMFGGDSGETQN